MRRLAGLLAVPLVVSLAAGAVGCLPGDCQERERAKIREIYAECQIEAIERLSRRCGFSMVAAATKVYFPETMNLEFDPWKFMGRKKPSGKKRDIWHYDK